MLQGELTTLIRWGRQTVLVFTVDASCHLHALSHSRRYLVLAWSVAVQQSLLDHGAVVQILPSQYECDDMNMLQLLHLATVPVGQLRQWNVIDLLVLSGSLFVHTFLWRHKV